MIAASQISTDGHHASFALRLVHGARDWMFPVETARWASDRLRAAGASLVYREIENLSHTYPREENDRILEWFDSTLALPREPSVD